jgi:hypothetical protein
MASAELSPISGKCSATDKHTVFVEWRDWASQDAQARNPFGSRIAGADRMRDPFQIDRLRAATHAVIEGRNPCTL